MPLLFFPRNTFLFNMNNTPYLGISQLFFVQGDVYAIERIQYTRIIIKKQFAIIQERIERSILGCFRYIEI